MKVQCDVCQMATAATLCCADEAALCNTCDQEVHSANKLAEKHQRVPLMNSSPFQIPTCDICQEKRGYFFCLEDRALLCRQCDAAVHGSSMHGAAHRRFLITGVRVADQQNPICRTGHGIANSNSRNPSVSLAEEDVYAASAAADVAWSLLPATVAAAELRPPWLWEEMLGGVVEEVDDGGYYGYLENGSKWQI